jgi:hypothetical protein
LLCSGAGLGWFGFILPSASLRTITRQASKLGIASRCRLFIIKAVENATLHLRTEDALDAADHVLIFTDVEREGIAGLRGATGAADPVRVCVGGVGHIIVDDVRYA